VLRVLVKPICVLRELTLLCSVLQQQHILYYVHACTNDCARQFHRVSCEMLSPTHILYIYIYAYTGCPCNEDALFSFSFFLNFCNIFTSCDYRAAFCFRSLFVHQPYTICSCFTRGLPEALVSFQTILQGFTDGKSST